MQTQCECKCSQEAQWVMRPIFMHFSCCQAPGEPLHTHTDTHTLAGSAEGCKRGCLEEVPTDATASHIQIINLVFFCFVFLLLSLSLLRDPPTPSAGILLWAGSLAQQSNAPVCSWSFILSDLLPFRMDQVQVRYCVASQIRAVLMQNIGQDMLRITWVQQTYAYFSVSSISKTSTIKRKVNADLC